jgi:hypothetical protein
MFINHYECPRCNHAWSSQCDDDCPACGCRHISPIDSEDDFDSVSLRMPSSSIEPEYEDRKTYWQKQRIGRPQ